MNRRIGGKVCRRALAAIASLTLVVIPIVAGQAPARAATGGVTVTNYTDPTISAPEGITAGPDGALWFTNPGNNSIGRITTDGSVTNFTDPTISFPEAITAGPDGAVWFINNGNGTIGRITTEGSVTNYPALDCPCGGITAGPDGALWYAGNMFYGIVRITTDGTSTEYRDATIVRPRNITAGPDGALWFTNSPQDPGTGMSSIGRITTDGTVTSYPTSDLPDQITAGPDGALWFTNRLDGSMIGRITTDGTITTYTGGGGGSIAAGPDGALWFTGGNFIGRITPDGTVTHYTAPTINAGFGDDITAGPDGALWFSNGANSIGRITTPPPPVVVPTGGSVTEGAPRKTSVLPITVTLSLSAPATHTVTAQWNTVFISGASGVQAVPGTDYIAASGAVTFPPGATTTTVPITVLNHRLDVPYKVVLVSFHNPTNATIGGFGGLAFGLMYNHTG